MPKTQRNNVNCHDWVTEMTGCFLRDQRKASDLTGEMLANKMHLSQQQISRYERGITKINLPTLIHFFSVLNMQEEEIRHFFELLVSQYQQEESYEE